MSTVNSNDYYFIWLWERPRNLVSWLKPKKSSLVSGIQQHNFFLSFTCLHNWMCIWTYTCFKKTHTNTHIQKAKETIKEKKVKKKKSKKILLLWTVSVVSLMRYLRWICREGGFPLANFFLQNDFFSVWIIKGRTLCFST